MMAPISPPLNSKLLALIPQLLVDIEYNTVVKFLYKKQRLTVSIEKRL